MLRRLRYPAAVPLLVLALCGGGLAAQAGTLKIPPPPKPAEPAVEPPVEQEPQPAAVAMPKLWDPPANAAEQIFLEFETQRSAAAPARAAALDRLRALGLETRATALKALGSEWGPSVFLAAELLDWVGLTAGEDPGDMLALVEAASRTGMVEAAGACLDTAARLHGGVLPSRAVSLLAHPNRNVRVISEGRLQRCADASHLERLLQFAEHGRDADVRLRAARLLGNFPEEPEVRLVLRRMLRDEAAEVAFHAAAALAGTARTEQVGFLVSELRQPCSGAEAGYLAYALLLQQQAHDAALIPEDALPRLEILLEDSDLFASAAAGACIAEYAYRAGGPETPASWSRAVPLVLVRAVSGAVFYPQFSRFAPLAEEALERISGEEHAESGAWLAWLDGLGPEGLRFLRGAMELGTEDLPRLRLAWARGAEGAETRVLAGAAAWLLPAERQLGAQELARLQDALTRSGLLTSVAASNRFGGEAEPVSLRLEIAAGAQRKRLVFRGTIPPAAQGLLADCESAWERAAWQMLAGEDPAGRAFVVQHLDAMEGADGAARAAAMAAMTRGRVAALPDAVLGAWCARLAATEELGGHWDLTLAAELLGEIPARAANPELALALVDAALLRPLPQAVAPLADAASAVEEPLRTRLLARGVAVLGLDGALALAADPRLAVRVAALSALPALGASAAPALRAALAAPDLPAQLAALRGLGELADAVALDEVAAFAAPGAPHELRKEAVWALGRIGEARALPTLQEAATSEQPALRVSALLAIAAIPGDEAQLALGALFPQYAGTALEGSYLRALLERGAAGARAALQPYLVSGDPVLLRRAALLGGLLGDPAAASSLMDWLPSDPRNPELLEALASTLCVDFRALPDPAGTYLAWWRDRSATAPASWFADAAAASGFRLAADFAVPGPQTRQAVEELLRVLEQGPAHLRASATYFLHDLTGVDGRIVLAGTPGDEVARRAADWRAWLDG